MKIKVCFVDIFTTTVIHFLILQSWIGEHGKSLESLDNMEKVENINRVNYNTLFMIQNTLLVTQRALFVNQITQNTGGS